MQALHSIPPPPPQGYPAQDTSTLGPSQSSQLAHQQHHVAPPPTPPAAQPPPPPHPDQSSTQHPHPVQQQPHPVQQQQPHPVQQQPQPVQQQPPHQQPPYPHPVQQQQQPHPVQQQPPHQQPPYPHPALTQDQQAAQQQQYAVAHASYLQQQLHDVHAQNAHLQAQAQLQAQQLDKKNKRRNVLSGVSDFLDSANNIVNITNSLRGPQENTVIIRETQVVAPEPVTMPGDAPAADSSQETAVPEGADPEVVAVEEQPIISEEGVPMEVAPECPPEMVVPEVEEPEMETEDCEIDWTCGLCSCNE